MEFGKYRRNTFLKYYNDGRKYSEDLDTFNDVVSNFWDATSNNQKMNSDNKFNMRRWNPTKNEYDFFAKNSKHWTFTDPNMKDDKSIQTYRKFFFI